MIQAGTISTGSGCTSLVVGLYWISSIRWVRSTTLPLAVATSRPTTNSSLIGGCSWRILRCMSSSA